MHNNKEMAFVYTEIHVFLALLMQKRSYEDSVCKGTLQGNMKLFHAKMKVKTCTVCENFMYVIVAVYFAYFESFIVYKNTRRPRYVSKKA